MSCLKCGKETADGQVFCQRCQEVMQRYPVKPGTAIHLPSREIPILEKKPVRQKEEANDQLSQLKTLTRWLTAAIALLSLLLCISAGMLLQLLQNQSAKPAIGKNYTTSQSQRP